VEPGRFLDGTETEFDESYYAALAVERLAANEGSQSETNTGSGKPVEVHILPIALTKGDDTGFVLMIVGKPDERLEHTIGNVVAEMRAVALPSQRGAERLDQLAFALCRRIDVLLALAHLRHHRADGRLPLDEVVAAGAGRDIVFAGPSDIKLLVDQAKAGAGGQRLERCGQPNRGPVHHGADQRRAGTGLDRPPGRGRQTSGRPSWPPASCRVSMAGC